MSRVARIRIAIALIACVAVLGSGASNAFAKSVVPKFRANLTAQATEVAGKDALLVKSLRLSGKKITSTSILVVCPTSTCRRISGTGKFKRKNQRARVDFTNVNWVLQEKDRITIAVNRRGRLGRFLQLGFRGANPRKLVVIRSGCLKRKLVKTRCPKGTKKLPRSVTGESQPALPPPTHGSPFFSLTNERVAFIKKDNWAFAADGNGTQNQIAIAGQSQQVVADGSRIGVVDFAGSVSIKEGPIGATWTNVMGNARWISLSGNRIGVVQADGSAYVKEGPVTATWTKVMGDVKWIILSGDRIGVVQADGSAYVKAGPVNATWTKVMGNVQWMSLGGDRIGVVQTDGSAYVKAGPVTATWTKVFTGASTISVSDSYVGVVAADAQGHINGKISASGWTALGVGIRSITLDGSRVGITTISGTGQYRAGSGWTAVSSEVR